MNSRVLELAARKRRLQTAVAAQRADLAQQAGRWAPALDSLDRMREAGRYLVTHPGWLAAGAVVLIVVRPRAALRWARRGYMLWRFAGSALASISALLPSAR